MRLRASSHGIWPTAAARATRHAAKTGPQNAASAHPRPSTTGATRRYATARTSPVRQNRKRRRPMTTARSRRKPPAPARFRPSPRSTCRRRPPIRQATYPHPHPRAKRTTKRTTRQIPSRPILLTRTCRRISTSLRQSPSRKHPILPLLASKPATSPSRRARTPKNLRRSQHPSCLPSPLRSPNPRRPARMTGNRQCRGPELRQIRHGRRRRLRNSRPTRRQAVRRLMPKLRFSRLRRPPNRSRGLARKRRSCLPTRRVTQGKPPPRQVPRHKPRRRPRSARRRSTPTGRQSCPDRSATGTAWR